MPVVLIGAIGGMVSVGIIGLFIGPVALAVGYQLFWQWVDQQPLSAESGVHPHVMCRGARSPRHHPAGDRGGGT